MTNPTTAIAATFCAGVYCCTKYGGARTMLSKARDKVRNWL